MPRHYNFVQNLGLIELNHSLKKLRELEITFATFFQLAAALMLFSIGLVSWKGAELLTVLMNLTQSRKYQ